MIRDFGEGEIHDGSIGLADDVGGNQRILGYFEDFLPARLGRGFLKQQLIKPSPPANQQLS